MKLFLRCGTYSKPDSLCDPSVLNVTTGYLVKALALSLCAAKVYLIPSRTHTSHPTDSHYDASRHYFTNTLYGRIFSITHFPFSSVLFLLLFYYPSTTLLFVRSLFWLHYKVYYCFSENLFQKFLQFGIPHYKLLLVFPLFQLLLLLRIYGTLHALSLCSLNL
jgi:hypothetical protein